MTYGVYIGASENELRLTNKQKQYYYCWMHYHNFEAYHLLADKTRMRGETDKEYSDRQKLESQHLYVYLKLVVNKAIEDYGRISDSEIFTFIDTHENSGPHVLITNFGRIFSIKNINRKHGEFLMGTSLITPVKGERRFTVYSNVKGPKYNEQYYPLNDEYLYRRQFDIYQELRKVFTVKDLVEHYGLEKAEYICYNKTKYRPSSFKTTIKIQNIKSKLIRTFESKKDMARKMGVSMDVLKYKFRYMKNRTFTIKKTTYLLLEDWKKDRLNVNAKPGHMSRAMTAKEKEMARKKREREKLKAEKKLRKQVTKYVIGYLKERERSHKKILAKKKNAEYQRRWREKKHKEQFDKVLGEGTLYSRIWFWLKKSYKKKPLELTEYYIRTLVDKTIRKFGNLAKTGVLRMGMDFSAWTLGVWAEKFCNTLWENVVNWQEAYKKQIKFVQETVIPKRIEAWRRKQALEAMREEIEEEKKEMALEEERRRAGCVMTFEEMFEF